MRCDYCGSRGHPEEYCPGTAAGQLNRLHLRCTYCGGRDHNYEGCPKLGQPRKGAVRLADKR